MNHDPRAPVVSVASQPTSISSLPFSSPPPLLSLRLLTENRRPNNCPRSHEISEAKQSVPSYYDRRISGQNCVAAAADRSDLYTMRFADCSELSRSDRQTFSVGHVTLPTELKQSLNAFYVIVDIGRPTHLPQNALQIERFRPEIRARSRETRFDTCLCSLQ